MKKFVLKYRIALVLGCIFLLALFLRTFELNKTPVGLHDDEVTNTYIGAFVLQHGVDLRGQKLPIFYSDKFGDYPPVFPMYITGLGALIFGNTVFGSRIITAILGSLLVLPMFGIAAMVFKNKKTGLFAAFLTAIIPWLVSFSRVSAEGLMGTFFFTTGLYFFLRGIKNQTMPGVVGGVLLFMFTYLLYPGFRIIAPLALLGSLVLVYKKGRSSKIFIVILVSTVIAFASTIAICTTEWGSGRAMQTSIFNPVSGVDLRNQQFSMNEKNIFIARMFNNKPIGYTRELAVQYSQYFSPDYLFASGGLPKHYMLPISGLFYFSTIFFLVIGLFNRYRKNNDKIEHNLFYYLMFLLLISPLPAALTVVDVPHMHRSIFMSVTVIFACAYGFNAFQNASWKKIPFYWLAVAALLIETVLFAHNYFAHVSAYQSINRNDGNQELAEFMRDNEKDYDAMYLTHEQRWIPIYYLYFSGNYDKSLAGKFESDFKIDRIGKMVFTLNDCATDEVLSRNKKPEFVLPKRALVIDSGQCESSESGKDGLYMRQREIKRVGASNAFIIYKVNKKNDKNHPE